MIPLMHCLIWGVVCARLDRVALSACDVTRGLTLAPEHMVPDIDYLIHSCDRSFPGATDCLAQ